MTSPLLFAEPKKPFPCCWLIAVGFLAFAFVAEAAPITPPPLPLSLISLYSFPSNQIPQTGFLLGRNGNFYVTTSTTATNTSGAILEVTPQGVLTNSISFPFSGGVPPLATLTQGGDGNFYGTTSAGGFSNNGTIFKVSPALDSIVTLARFDNTNGGQPYAPLVGATNGLFYGTTFNGGASNLGTIFSVNALGVLNTLFTFDLTNGANPYAAMIQAKNGNLYGTTRYGGTNGQGTIFSISLSGNFTNLFSFDGANGSDPRGMVEGSDGNFYGVTFSGGSNDLGTLFEMTSLGYVFTLASFGAPAAANPNGPLVQASSGAFYGTTLQGGINGFGTVFQFFLNSRTANPSNATFSIGSASFGGNNGAYPSGSLIQDTNGNLFGATSYGGANGAGTIFELTGFPPTGTTQPINEAFIPGGTATFFVPTTGSAPLSYQWEYNGVPLINGGNISGATTPTLTISSEGVPDVGTYSVIISNPYGVVTNTTVLTVPAPTFTVKPLLPASTTVAILPINGTAVDKSIGVTAVEYQVGTNVAVATTTNQWTNWSASVPLQPGSNLVQIWDVDEAGNSSRTNSYEIFYYVTNSLVLVTNGSGRITTPAGFNPGKLIVGKTYTLTAVPAAGNLFSNWTGSITRSTPTISFLMGSNMMLTANFVTNVFKTAAGVYSGLFYERTNTITPGTAGLLNALTVTSSGAYSGRLLLAGSNFLVSGAFDVAGAATNTIARSASNGGPVTLAMNLDWSTSPPALDGTVSALGTNSPQWTSELMAEPQTANRTSAAYTILLQPGRDASGGPPGAGYALINNHLGAATLVGALPDGTAFSQTVAVSDDAGLPLYVSLDRGAGVLVGWITNLDTGAPTGDLTWITPASSAGLYPSGFTNTLLAQGSLWTNPPVHAAPISLTGGQLTISGGFLAAPLEFNVSVNTSDALVKLSASPTNSLTGAINAKTGLLTLTFGNGAGKATIAAQGAVLQNQSIGAGFFVTKTNAGSISLQ